ncbi:MAG: type IX secretion system membrane protein PorP/SprF, partial [Ferruginibacter sp.]
MKKLTILISCLLFTVIVNGQDMLFTQFQYAPIYFNPGLTGCSKNNLRVTGVSKLQWFNLYKPFKYIAASADMSVYDDNQRNVVNLALAANHSSKGYINNTNISGVLARSFGTNNEDCSNWFLNI